MKTLLKIFNSLMLLAIGTVVVSSSLQAAGLEQNFFRDAGIATGVAVATELVVKQINHQNADAPGTMMYSAFNITELTTKLGDYLRDRKKEDLISSMLMDFVPEDNFTVMDGVTDEMPMANLELLDLVKPANDIQFQPTSNALQFGARILKVRRWKVDLLLVPAQLEKTWIGLYKKRKGDVMEIVFEQYILDHIQAKVSENLRMQSLYRGVYNGAGSTPIDVFDGIDTLVKAERTAENLVPVTTGSITNENVVEKLLQIHDALNPALKNTATIMPVNSQIYDWYVRKAQPILNPSVVVVGNPGEALKGGFGNEAPLIGTNCTVKREPGKASSQLIWCTAKANLFYGTDTDASGNDIRFQEFERTIKVLIDGRGGVQIGTIANNMLVVNNQN